MWNVDETDSDWALALRSSLEFDVPISYILTMDAMKAFIFSDWRFNYDSCHRMGLTPRDFNSYSLHLTLLVGDVFASGSVEREAAASRMGWTPESWQHLLRQQRPSSHPVLRRIHSRRPRVRTSAE